QIASAGTTQRAITGTFHQGPLGLAHEPHTIAAALDEITAGAGPHLGAALTQPRFSVTSESEFEVIPPGGRPDGTPEPYLQFRRSEEHTSELQSRFDLV